MKRKNILTKIILLTLTTITSLQSVSAFLDGDLGLDLYENIDKGLYELELNIFQREIKDGDEDNKVNEILNLFALENYGLKPCFKNSLEITSPDKYIQTAEVYSYIDESCLGKDGKISTKDISEYEKAINDFVQKAKINSQEKAEQIHSISRIGLYSDGDTNNSPFDIINDLQQIDNVIFGEEIEYFGEDNGFLTNFKSNPFMDSTISPPEGNGNLGDDGNGNNNSGGNNNNGNGNNNSGNTPDENGICLVDESGLNPDDLAQIINNSANNNQNPTNNSSSNSPLLPDTNQIEIPNIVATNYANINDNALWPCEGFFCIQIDFNTYEHKLLGYGETKSIESVLVTSNEHLKKGANTSLLQSRMTTNNFELGLRDLDFPNMFHMGFQVSSEPVPILDLEDKRNWDEENQTEEDIENGKDPELSEKLRNYYKNLGLDYDRANDLNIFSKLDNELKNIQDSAGLNIATPAERQRNIDNIQASISKINNYINESVDKEINQNILKEFDREFSELEVFITGLQEYSDNLNLLIKKLKEIPIYK